MATVKTFRAVRPAEGLECRVAALPYDVYNREEARVEAAKEKLSFLNIDRPETQFPVDQDMYAPEVYRKAADMLEDQFAKGVYLQEEKPAYYLYELTMNGRSQTGFVACASIDDYVSGVIRKHENTRADKEEDRIRHVDTCNAQTGPIFLAYRQTDELRRIMTKVKEGEAYFDFVSSDGIGHRGWIIDNEELQEKIRKEFAHMQRLYIADGHHRAASAVKVGLKRRSEHPDYTGEEEFNYFLSVLFPDEELLIMDYNRVVKDLNGLTKEEFLGKVGQVCEIRKQEGSLEQSRETMDTIGIGQAEDENLDQLPHPLQKGQVSLYLDHQWYSLTFKPEYRSDDPVEGLDVQILQKQILTQILNIQDPRTDKRIDFVGGIRGLGELVRRVDELDGHSQAAGQPQLACAFAMYPTSIHELFAVADANRLMPPKSTWFEPKLRSGLFIHQIER